MMIDESIGPKSAQRFSDNPMREKSWSAETISPERPAL
jgi:hypothetical protein